MGAARVVREHLKAEVNVPQEGLVQFVSALGAAILAQRRLQKLNSSSASVQQAGDIPLPN